MQFDALGLTAFLLMLPVLSCNGGNVNDQKMSLKSISEVPVAKWEKLSSMKIYFGHQSVGYNILDGIKAIIKENPQIALNIVESIDFESHNSGALFHSKVGQNTDPKSKMDDFEKILTSKKSDQIDVAFLKLCYVDITANSKPQEIFANYEDMIKRIRLKNTKTKIIHLTTPLTRTQIGIKASLKKILGKPLHGYAENIKRHEYDRLLRSSFAETVFDLSKFESTLPDGSRVSFKQNGRDYYSLAPEYTSDGGHLNEEGREIIAKKLLLFLVNQI